MTQIWQGISTSFQGELRFPHLLGRGLGSCQWSIRVHSQPHHSTESIFHINIMVQASGEKNECFGTTVPVTWFSLLHLSGSRGNNRDSLLLRHPLSTESCQGMAALETLSSVSKRSSEFWTRSSSSIPYQVAQPRTYLSNLLCTTQAGSYALSASTVTFSFNTWPKLSTRL